MRGIRSIKRLLVLGVSALTLLSTPVAAGAAPVVEQVFVEQNEATTNLEKLISETTYRDKDGEPVTEKVYFNFNQSASASKAYSTSIGGIGTYRKEKTFYIRTGKTTKARLVAYVEIKAMFKDGVVKINSCTGGFRTRPGNVIILNQKKYNTSSKGIFSFYAKSNYSKKQLYSVEIAINGRGLIS